MPPGWLSCWLPSCFFLTMMLSPQRLPWPWPGSKSMRPCVLDCAASAPCPAPDTPASGCHWQGEHCSTAWGSPPPGIRSQRVPGAPGHIALLCRSPIALPCRSPTANREVRGAGDAGAGAWLGEGWHGGHCGSSELCHGSGDQQGVKCPAALRGGNRQCRWQPAQPGAGRARACEGLLGCMHEMLQEYFLPD